MYRYSNYLPGKTNKKQLRVLYIDDIVDDGAEEEASAWEMIYPSDYENYDVIIFKYTNGKTKQLDMKKKK